MALFTVRVGDKYLGGVPLWRLSAEHRLKFTTAAEAEAGVVRARDYHPEQSLDGYVIEEMET